MHSFDYFNPQALPEAFELLASLNGQAKIIAGGTILLPQMKGTALTPAAVVNIKRLAELKGITYNDTEGLHLGALTTLSELIRASVIQQHYPVLAHIAGLMATPQIRNLATIGGNLSNAAPFADLAPPLIALGATAHLASLTTTRQLPLESFFLGPGQTVLAPGELLTHLNVPPPAGRTIYLKHSLRPATFMGPGVVGVAARLWLVNGLCQAVAMVLGAVAPTPVRAQRAEAVLLGQPLTADLITQAAKTAAEECVFLDDMRSSAWYRQRIVQVLVERALVELTLTK